MLDGAFKCCNHFFDVRRQLATTLDIGQQRDRRTEKICALEAGRADRS
jgi:hypothetical protein